MKRDRLFILTGLIVNFLYISMILTADYMLSGTAIPLGFLFFLGYIYSLRLVRFYGGRHDMIFALETTVFSSIMLMLIVGFIGVFVGYVGYGAVSNVFVFIISYMFYGSLRGMIDHPIYNVVCNIIGVLIFMLLSKAVVRATIINKIVSLIIMGISIEFVKEAPIIKIED